jgi:pyoverdine/dityrosine biosynthesis protein Dit1
MIFQSWYPDHAIHFFSDRGEELAFGVLEHFCMDVEKIYPPGAEVVIFSDGRVFSGKMEI